MTRIASLKARAEAGDVGAQVEYAIAYTRGEITLDEQGRSALFSWLIEAAKRGDPGAQCEVGSFYEWGQGVTPDQAEAVRWYRHAAENGDSIAQGRLAQCYLHGRGVARDVGRALEWFEAAIARGSALAAADLGVLLRRGDLLPLDLPRALELLSSAAGQGDSKALAELAHCYAHGVGVAKDPSAAARFALRAADAGDPWSQWFIGMAYSSGWGVPRDVGAAEHWLAQAGAFPGAPALLRRVRFERRFGVRPRRLTLTLAILGWAMLAYHTLTAPLRFEPLLVLLAVATATSFGVLLMLALWLSERTTGGTRALSWLDSQVDDHAVVDAGFERRLLVSGQLLFWIPAEDGLFFLPLLYVGVSPWTVAIASLLFSLAHYPKYSPALCLFKGAFYYGFVLWLLPHGIWTLVAAHLAIDALAFAVASWGRNDAGRRVA